MSIDIQRILNELKKIPRQEQIMLQKVKGKDDNYGIGSLTAKDYPENEFNVLVYPELEYTNSIITDLNMCRTRVLVLHPKTCYSLHRDTSKRIHIPVVTNEKCWMIVNKEIMHLPADGRCYEIDTTQEHTALNGSWEARTHIVGCVKGD